MSYDASSLYGNYRTLRFTDIYQDAEAFMRDYNDIGKQSFKIPKEMDGIAETIFYLLYARYGNSHIASSDPNRFRFLLFSKIFQYGPTWKRRLDVQESVRNMSEEDLLQGSKQIYNQARNPSTKPTTGSLEELPKIDNQSTANNKRGKLDAYAFLESMLRTDVTEDFLRRFKDMFLIIVEPELPLWYETPAEEEI